MHTAGETSSPRADELVKALEWLALTPSVRRHEPDPCFTPLSADERRAILAAVNAHESGVAVSEVLGLEEKADALMPRPLVDTEQLEWIGEGEERRATDASVASYYAKLAKDSHAIESHRFRKNLCMALQFLPRREALKIFLMIWKSWRFTDERHERTVHVLGVLARVRRDSKDRPKREAVAAEAGRRRVSIPTVLGELRDAARLAGERVQRPHTRPKRRRTN